MGAWDEVIHIDNLQRAWRWVRTNPNAEFKAYVRDLYTLYAIAGETLLRDLQNRLKRQTYQPTRACKLFLVKPSGILRPYTLLTVEDQIVYQAAVNVIAERLFPRVRHRYNREVFGHLYAGKRSQWFYRKWSKGYGLFNAAIRQAVDDGYKITASFDLTACYDSLDHGVLRNFLKQLRCEPECCRIFTEWLSTWTATEAGYYHNHGIPQGPQPSGLVAEVVLQHFDSNRGRESRVRYFRYVDDIRMFARTERELRHMLVRLDMLSKDIGLFPQSSKIDIHQVKDIREEVKSLSHPFETALKQGLVNQERLRKRIVALSRRFKVSDPTRFKYLIGRAAPNSTLTCRLLRIYERSPIYYSTLARYLQKYKRLPTSATKQLLGEIKRQMLYPVISAEFIRTLDGRVPTTYVAKADDVLRKMWQPASLPPVLLAAVGRYLIHRDKLTFSQVKYACSHPKSWWARSQLVLCLDDHVFGAPSFASLINHALRDHSAEVAMAAAYLAQRDSIAVERPTRSIQPHAASSPLKKSLRWAFCCGQ